MLSLLGFPGFERMLKDGGRISGELELESIGWGGGPYSLVGHARGHVLPDALKACKVIGVYSFPECLYPERGIG